MDKTVSTLLALGAIGIFLLAFVGWVLNIIQLLHMHQFSTTFVLKCIGILLGPLGSVLGYF
jgi:hypothetical protein